MHSSITLPISEWLEKVVPIINPSGVVAFALNLAESGDWIAELIGSSTYDPDDGDWACPPGAWTSRPSELVLMQSTAGSNWEQAQEYVVAQISGFLKESASPAANVLRSAQAVCVGFVDGDLVRVWPPEKA